MVIVRNKKRVGYTYELTLKVKGEVLSTILFKDFNLAVLYSSLCISI